MSFDKGQHHPKPDSMASHDQYSYRGSSRANDASSTFNNSDESLYTYESVEQGNVFQRFTNSFKRIDLEDDGIDTSEMTELEKSIYATANHPLARRLKTRHLFWIAFGGVIGSGLFVGSGFSLSQAGPAGFLIGYIVIGYAMLCVVLSLSEIATQFAVSGSFVSLFSRMIHPSWSFTLGILYSLSWLISFPSELIACSMTIKYWNSSINPCVWVAVFYVFIFIVNLFGVRGYGDIEMGISIIKILAVIGFIILGICIICGVGDQGYIGGQYWHNPGAFNHGFKGVCSSFISAAFTFGGTELVALAAAETANPRHSLPKATKQVFWRITIFYFLTAIVIGCLVPYTNEQLINGTGITASPFVIAVSNGGIKVVPHIMNAVVLLAIVSVANSSVYGCSRTLASLSAQGLLPWFDYIDKEGRPIVAIMFTNVIGLLGFLAAYEDEDRVFTWFFSICSLSSFFIWGSICFTHVRFRMALRAQGRGVEEVAFVSPLGLFGSISGIIILFLVICAEIWTSIWPIGESADVVTFWQNCLSLPLMLVMWFLFNLYKKSFYPFFIPLEEIDLDTGRRDVDVELLKQEIADEKLELQSKPFYYKIYKFFC